MVKTCSRAVVVANAVSLASAGINKLAQTVLVGRGVGWFVLANCDRQFMNGFSWSICWLLIGQCQFAVPILSIIQFFKHWEQSIWLHCGKKSGMQWFVSRFLYGCIPWMAAIHCMVAFHDMLIASVPGVLRDAPADMQTHETVVDTQIHATVFIDFLFTRKVQFIGNHCYFY